MYGAILGDIIGSRFEFDQGGKTKNFKLFTKEDSFTDDTVMTIAVADGLIQAGANADEEKTKRFVIDAMKFWGRKYPNAGYGSKFYWWLKEDNPKPYGSFGNGSAMRVSICGWLKETIEETRTLARWTAEVSHNHKEGIKGAECTAAVIFLARTGKSKEEIKNYVTKEFGYDLSETLDEMRQRHEHVETCMDSLPKALVSFFEGNSYEDVVRNAISLGGDTDTLGAIAGAMAEGMYGVPEELIQAGNVYLNDYMLKVVSRYTNIVKGLEEVRDRNPEYFKNRTIKFLVDQYPEHLKVGDNKFVLNIIDALISRMLSDGTAPCPMNEITGAFNDIDPLSLEVGDTFTIPQEQRYVIDSLTDPNGKKWIPLFTNQHEINKGKTGSFIFEMAIEEIINDAIRAEDISGIIINPFDKNLVIEKDMLKSMIEILKQNRKGSDENA